MNDTLPANADDEISLLDLLQVIADNLRLLVLGPLAVGLVALGISFVVPPTFTAKTQFLPPQQQQSAAASMLASLGSLGGLAGAATGLKNPSDQYLAFMKSVSVQDALIERFKLIARYEAKSKIDARKALTENTRIASGKDGLISVEVDDKEPQFAADLANAYSEELQKLLARLAVTEAQQRRLFFEKQLGQAKESLATAEKALKSTGVNSSALKSTPAAAVENVARLRAAISAQEVKLASMRGYLAESSPDFKQALNELGALRAQLAKAEKDEPSIAGGSDYVARYRDYKYYETLFELFAKQYELARVDESREGAVIQVLDVAQTPERKSKPNKAQVAVIATLASCFALLLWVFVRQALKNAGESPETAGKIQNLKSAFARALGRSRPMA
jgi:tyrosine-protein kinase Etk/Wzc